MPPAKHNFAASRLVNPLGASPKLTEAQVWKGLEIKARHPENFVAAITSCDIVSDSGSKIVRFVSFGNNKPVEENIDLYRGTIAYFDSPEAETRITNVLSYDGNGELLLTFSFTGGVPGYRPQQGELPTLNELNKSVGMGIELTIERIRELVQEGAISLN
ncbi:hypothetical protein BDQ17DRAFT_1238205 [Cyathus striatus]|nr:hypothetical protein BDQ17DRAFT_1238205 [Cyathus striatus]